MFSAVLTLEVALTWLIVTALVFGVGALFLRALVPVERTWGNACLAVLCGFALLFAALLLWHFLLPVNASASWTFAALGALALVRERAWVRELLRKPPATAVAIPVILFWIWAANRSLSPGAWDDYVYEYQAVRWIHDFRIVPGLANVHGRFGFASAHHLYASLLSVGPWTGRVNMVINGLFIVLTFAVSWSACVDLLRRRFSERAVFTSLFLAPCLAHAIVGVEVTEPLISTLKADVAIGALTLVVVSLWLELCDRAIDESRRCALAVTIVLSCAMLFSLKLSSAALGGTIALAAFVWMASNARARTLLAPVAAVVAVIVAAVLIRGVVLSGYPMYPSAVFPIDVDWRVPEAQAAAERSFITSFAQIRPTYDVPLPPANWFPLWARTTILTSRLTLVMPGAIALGLLPLVILGRRRAPIGRVPAYGWIVVWGGSAAALALWFVQAPAARFAWSYFWVVGASVVALAVGRTAPKGALLWPAAAVGTLAATVIWKWSLADVDIAPFVPPLAFVAAWCTALAIGPPRLPAAAGILCLALGAYPLVERLSAHVLHRRWQSISRLVWRPVARMPEVSVAIEITPHTTRSGLTVYEVPWSKYDTPLPSSPYFNPYLELRRPPDFQYGFRNAGRLPYPLIGYYPRFLGLNEY